MAGGFSQSHLMFSQASPHRFIEKPFSVEELLDEVRAAFAGGDLFQPA
jgi:FixJ family two-component response regulator